MPCEIQNCLLEAVAGRQHITEVAGPRKQWVGWVCGRVEGGMQPFNVITEAASSTDVEMQDCESAEDEEPAGGASETDLAYCH